MTGDITYHSKYEDYIVVANIKGSDIVLDHDFLIKAGFFVARISDVYGSQYLYDHHRNFVVEVGQIINTMLQYNGRIGPDDNVDVDLVHRGNLKGFDPSIFYGPGGEDVCSRCGKTINTVEDQDEDTDTVPIRLFSDDGMKMWTYCDPCFNEMIREGEVKI